MKIAKITLALGALSLFSLSAGAQENAPEQRKAVR
jgi:pectate lyase